MIDESFAGDLWLLLLAQGTACLMVGLATSYALRHRPAHAHQVLLTSLLAAVLMPGLYLWAQHCGVGVLAPGIAPPTPEIATAWPLRTPPLAAEIAYNPAPWTVAEAVPVHPMIAVHLPWRIVAMACWLTATLVLLMRLSLRFLLGARLLRTAAPLETGHVARMMEEAKSRLGIEKPVRIRGSEKVRSPVIWCWVREPVLLLQTAAADRPKGTDWASVFCHELAHWRRRDHWSGLFAEVLMALFPWHPLLWWAKGRLLTLSEQACDDWVLATGHRGEDYADTLLSLAAQRQMAFLPTVIGRKKTMRMRIHRIIQNGGSNPRIRKRWTLSVSVTVVLVSVGVALAQQAPVPPQTVEPPQTQTSAPPSNPLVAPEPAQTRQFKVPERGMLRNRSTARSPDPAATPRRIQRTPAEMERKIRAETRVYALAHIRPEKMKAMVEALIEKPESITAFAKEAKAAVYATVETHQRIQRIIRIIDVPEDDPNLAPDEPRVAETQIITLKYFSARQMQDLLRAMVGETGYAVADEQRHCLNVRTTPANMRRVESVVRELDVPADDRVFQTEVEELRGQMRRLNEQMQQILNRLEQIAAQDRQDKVGGSSDRPRP